MKRSLYPDGVEVTQDDVERTETTKSDAIKDRASEATRMVRAGADFRPGGVVSGLRVTRNTTAPNDTVDISPGIAYTPNGERIIVSVSQTDQALSDPTDGVPNFVCLVYTEVNTTNRPHETDGTTRATEATASFRVAVKTQAELDALPAVSTSDLSIDAADRTVVLARVIGNGAGVALVTPGEFFQAALLTVDKVHAEYGSNPVLGPLPGVNIVGHGTIVAPGTFIVGETAQIKLVVVSAASKDLSYKQEGEATFGTGVNVATLTGTTTLTSVAGSTLTVDVDELLLPVTSASNVRELTVTPLYDVDGPLHSPADIVHRHQTGDAATTTGNPHGTGINDLAQSFMNFLGTLGLGDDLLGTLDAALTPRIVMDTADGVTLGANTKTLLTEFRAGLASTLGPVRIYLDAATNGLEITSNAAWNTTTAQYDPDETGASKVSYQLQIGRQDASDSILRLAAETAPSGSFVAFDDVISSNNTALMNLGAGMLLDATEATAARLQINADPTGANVNRVLMLSSLAGLFGTPDTVNVYRGGFSASGTSGGLATIDVVFSASWNNTTLLWSNTGPGSTAATKLEFTHTAVTAWTGPVSGTWADTESGGAWVKTAVFTFATGAVELFGVSADINTDANVVAGVNITTTAGDVTAGGGGDVVALGGGDFAYSPARTFTKVILAATGTLANSTTGIGNSTHERFGAPPGYLQRPRIDTSSSTFLTAVVWPVELPVDSVVKEIRINGLFTMGGGDSVQVTFASVNLLGTVVSQHITSPPFTVTVSGTTTITIPVSPTVTLNSNNAYYVRLDELGTHSTINSTIETVEIDYEITNLRTG